MVALQGRMVSAPSIEVVATAMKLNVGIKLKKCTLSISVYPIMRVLVSKPRVARTVKNPHKRPTKLKDRNKCRSLTKIVGKMSANETNR
jgi:uncharacterized protein YcfJ